MEQVACTAPSGARQTGLHGIAPMQPVFLGIAAAVITCERWEAGSAGSLWTMRLCGPSALMVGMNQRRAERRDAERMAWMMRLKVDNPGMYSTRRYVAEVLPMVTSEMHQRARAC